MTSITVTPVGHCAAPVVVIDDFHPEPARLRAMAEGSTFAKSSPHYPGVQAPADPRHLAPVSKVLEQVFRDVFGLTGGVSLVQCAFSLVTTPEAHLTPLQSLPHIDTPDPGRIALLHYMSGEEMGGTAFYRHRTTGLEALNTADFATFTRAVQSEPVPVSGYLRGSNAYFEQIGSVDARPNRAVLYRSQLLHSGQIPADLPLSDDPKIGRLTVNSFFQARS